MVQKNTKVALAALAGLGGTAGLVHDLHAAVVIQEVYGGGGSGSTTVLPAFKTDFIELYNNGAGPVNITGDIVAYASSSSTAFNLANGVTLPSATLQAGQYFLIAGTFSATYTGATLPVTADVTSMLNLSATAGEVGLFAPGTAGTQVINVGDGSPTNSVALDGLGYGNANQSETTAVGVLSTTTAAFRTVTGVDTNVNLADFTVGTPQSPQNLSGTSVPEPASLGMAVVASSLLVRRRKAK